MYKFLYYDEPEPEVLPVEDAGPDYLQLIYESVSKQEFMSGSKQEEYFAAYTEKLDSIDTQLQQLNQNLEWIVALLVFAIVLHLSSRVRGWVTMLTGGMKDVL